MSIRALTLFCCLTAAAACSTSQPASNDHTRHASNSQNAANGQNSTIDHSQMDHSTMDHSGLRSSPGAAEAPYELQFIDTMIEHHKAAVDMARLAETRASRPELKDLARKIVADQEREIAQMRAWRDEYFAGAAPAINMDFPGMQEGMTGMDMNRLESLTGPEFDQEFIRQMVPHHEGAVIMAKDSLAKAAKFDPNAEDKAPISPEERAKVAREFRQMAATIVSAQQGEIAQMRGWIK